MKKIYEGYLCHTVDREETYEYISLLSTSVPVAERTEDTDFYGIEKLVVPRDFNDVIFYASDLFKFCEKGKRYRVTIEEIDDGDVK